MPDVSWLARYAYRRWRVRPALGLIVAALLATGIGLNSAAFAVLRGVAFRALPYADPDELYFVTLATKSCLSCALTVPSALVRAWQRNPHLAGQIGAFRQHEGSLDVNGEDHALGITVIMPSTLEVLRATPALGALFAPTDYEESAPRRVLLSAALWRERYGSDPDIVGKRLRLDGDEIEIAGVLTPRFTMPQSARADVFVTPAATPREQAPRYTVVIRTSSTNALERLRVDLANDARLAGLDGDGRTQAPIISMRSLRLTLATRDSSLVAILQALTLLVLVVTCANVAALLASRAQAERTSTAIRVALGARRRDLFALALADTLPLTLVGAAIGLWGAARLVLVVRPLLYMAIPEWADISVNATVVLVTGAVVVLAAVALAAAPLAESFRSSVNPLLQDAIAGDVGRREGKRRQETLVTIQLAIGTVLLIAAGILTTNYMRLDWRESQSVLSRSISAELTSRGTAFPAFAAEMDAVLARARESKAVDRAYFLHSIILGIREPNVVFIDGRVDPVSRELAPDRGAAVWSRHFDGSVFPTMRGRFFSAAELESRAPVIVVSEAVARRLWGELDPLGRAIRIPTIGPGETWRTVIGIIPDMRAGDAILAGGAPPRGRFYVPFSGRERSARLVVRTHRSAEALTDSVRRMLTPVIPHALSHFQYDGEFDRVMNAMAKTRTLLLASLAAIAVLLSLAGLATLVSHSTTLRLRELAVRAALGATPAVICLEVVRDAASLSARGLMLGAAGSFVAVYVIVPLIYFNVTLPNWPLVLAIFLTMSFITLAANLLSARRAMRTDFATILRSI